MTYFPSDLDEFLNSAIEIDAPPLCWTPEIVGLRLIEAAIVIRHTVAHPGHRRIKGHWPDYRHDFEDILGRGEEARQEVLQRWGRSKPHYSAATIQRAEQAALWPLELLADREGACRILTGWATCKAARRPVSHLLRRKRWNRATFARKRADGLRRIAEALTARGVPVMMAEAVCT